MLKFSFENIKITPLTYIAFVLCTTGLPLDLGGYYFMKKIPLSQSRKCKNSALNLFALVDDEDFDRINKFKWSVCKQGNTIYALRLINPNKSIRMHREVMKLYDSDKLVDHKDRDGLNNQKSNLRICTLTENGANRRPDKNKSSKYLGVCYIKTIVNYASKKNGLVKYDRSAWWAFIKHGSVRLNLGKFNSEDEAALAYNEAAKKYHGEFANLNIIKV